MPSDLYVDASTIAGLVFGEVDLASMQAVVQPSATLTYSDFGFGEVVSAISARIRAVEGTDKVGAIRLAEARAYLTFWHVEYLTGGDLAVATEMVSRPSIALKFADAIHLAMVQRLDGRLLTNDRQQHRAAEALAIPSIILGAK